MLNPDYRDILSVFFEENIEYLLVGAYALAAHGYPRATGDIDLWIRPERENAERVMRALARFGAPLTGVKISDFAEPGIVFQMGIAPRRIDVLTVIDGVTFEPAWQAREEIEIEGITVPVISRFHLTQNKRAAGRPKDRADLTWLEGDERE